MVQPLGLRFHRAAVGQQAVNPERFRRGETLHGLVAPELSTEPQRGRCGVGRRQPVQRGQKAIGQERVDRQGLGEGRAHGVFRRDAAWTAISNRLMAARVAREFGVLK